MKNFGRLGWVYSHCLGMFAGLRLSLGTRAESQSRWKRIATANIICAASGIIRLQSISNNCTHHGRRNAVHVCKRSPILSKDPLENDTTILFRSRRTRLSNEHTRTCKERFTHLFPRLGGFDASDVASIAGRSRRILLYS
jgi:hypothetical protein